MNTKTIFNALCLALIAAAASAQPAPMPEGAASQAGAPVPVQMTVDGAGQIDGAILTTGAPVYAEFQASPRLTRNLREELRALGANVMEKPEEAAVTLRIAAVYSFQKPRSRRQQLDFGQVVEETRTDIVAQQADRSTRTVGVELGPAIEGVRGNLSFGMVLGTGIADSVLRLTGARGWFNRLVAGDERGICLGTADSCKDWKKYAQEMNLSAVVDLRDGGRQMLRSQASAKDERLVPDALFREAMHDLTRRLMPPAKPADAGAP